MMQWQRLFSDQRSEVSLQEEANHRLRTSFIKDYDRIIFSSAFRRLQNKTQVFPLPGPAFVHNRLTHTLEVASVGRSLGTAVGNKLADLYAQHHPKNFETFYRHELAAVISAACLAHDIGNPPFGHSGEDAIRSYFNDLVDLETRFFTDEMTENQWADFTWFEGNANAFRILTHPYAENQSAYNITQTTLASFVKYPCPSKFGFDKTSGLISLKKSGFFDSEIKTWENTAERLGIPKVNGYESEVVYQRHPFVFLTEAADDICYRVIDIEDAHRLGIISYDEILKLFTPFFDDDQGYYAADNLLHKLTGINDPNQKVQYIRALWIGRMVGLCTDLFFEKEQDMLLGTLNVALLDGLKPSYQHAMKAINDVSIERIYNHKTVVEIEIAGFQVIGDLLDIFMKALKEPTKSRSEKVLQLIPKQFPIDFKQQSLYQNVQSVTDFISGMTDLYAIDLYRKITGITIKPI